MVKTRAELMRELGSWLRAERKKAGLSQDALGLGLGLKQPWGHSYVGRLERGVAGDVGFCVVVQYLQVCKAPIGRFILELAQSGAFGEAEPGLAIALDSSSLKLEQEKQAQVIRATTRFDTELQLQMAFDRIEQVGISQGMIPDAVHKLREIVFAR